MKREAINHPKIRLLARDLGVSINEARGICCALWMVAAINFPRGDVGRLSNAELAVAIDWEGDADALIDRLVSRRLVDEVSVVCGRLYIHDWHEHADDTVHYKLARAGMTFANGAESRRKRTVNRPSPTGNDGQATVADSRRQSKSVTDGLSSPSPSPSPSPPSEKDPPPGGGESVCTDRPASPLVLALPEPDPPRVSPDDITAGWNDLARFAALPTVRLPLTTARTAKLRLRLRDHPDPTTWTDTLHRIADSPFCCGDNDRGWRASFDWLLQPDTVAKVLEGKYDRAQLRVVAGGRKR